MARMDWDDFYPQQGLSMTIHEDDNAPVESGLLNANGEPLYRPSPKQPIGFQLTGATSMAKKKSGGGKKC